MCVLRRLGVPDDRILLNLHDGPEEIDAFVDMDGTLLMIELKDNEFSMGHAYPFGGRIGLYKPDYAIIVATRGVASDVKDYFETVKPQSTIIYIDRLNQLASSLEVIMKTIRTQRAEEVLTNFELVDIQIPSLLASKIDLKLPGKRSIRFRE